MKCQRIVCPIDFSESNNAAVVYATQIAANHGASIAFVHVDVPPLPMAMESAYVPVEMDPGIAEKQLREIIPADPSVPCEHVVLTGNPGEAIAHYAADNQADLIVMATHGRSGLSRVLMGSVAETVVRAAPCPVLIVRGMEVLQKAGKTGKPGKRAAVCAVDFSAGSQAVMNLAADVAAMFHCELHLLHVTEISGPGSAQQLGPERDQWSQDERQLEQCRPTNLAEGIPIIRHQKQGNPAKEIVRFAGETDACVLVLGTHGRTGLKRLLMGSVAEYVLRHAACPVFVMKLADEAAGSRLKSGT